MKDFAKSFYLSPAWEATRAAYFKKAGGLCELCLKEGLYNPGEIVHHKIFLTPDNVSNPDIALAESNLMLVCREHHAQLHKKERKGWRFIIDEYGRVQTIE